MIQPGTRRHAALVPMILVVAVIAALFPAQICRADESNDLAVRAEFVHELDVPGTMDHFLRPSKLVFDAQANEIYVADQGHNRIVIFNPQGVYRFEFGLGKTVGSIVDFTVDGDGYIYVLASTAEGRKLLKFDFDGLPLGVVTAESALGPGTSLTRVTVGPPGRVYLIDESVPRLLRLTPEGSVALDVELFPGIADSARQELALGWLSATADELLLPIASQGRVQRLDPDGRLLGAIGHYGGTTGGLTFPIAAARAANGMWLVLDKRRFVVACYSSLGRFVGEFGGKGARPGWFYFPSSLVITGAQQVCISQVFNNLIQICRIPQSIQRRFESAESPVSEDASLGQDGAEGPGFVTREINGSVTVHHTHHHHEGGLR